MLEVQVNGGENRQLFPVPKGMLASSNLYMRAGGYAGTVSSQFYVVVGVSLSATKIVEVKAFGNDYTSSSVLRVWYR